MASESCFDDYFQEMAVERYNAAIQCAMDSDPVYKEYLNRFYETFDKIKSLIGSENAKLIIEFDEASHIRESAELDRVYWQGLKDGIRLSRILGGIG